MGLNNRMLVSLSPFGIAKVVSGMMGEQGSGPRTVTGHVVAGEIPTAASWSDSG